MPIYVRISPAGILDDADHWIARRRGIQPSMRPLQGARAETQTPCRTSDVRAIRVREARFSQCRSVITDGTSYGGPKFVSSHGSHASAAAASPDPAYKTSVSAPSLSTHSSNTLQNVGACYPASGRVSPDSS